MDSEKELLLIGIEKNNKAENCCLKGFTDKAQSLNHEEYHGYPGRFSPDSEDLETKPEKYEGTKALDQYNEIKDFGNDSGL